jgi:FAD:protein FMN transferase
MTQRYVMGTFLAVLITGEDYAELTRIFLDEVQHLEELLSIYRPDSEISQINRAAGHHAVAVSEDTLHVIQEALRFAAQSGGAFDPTVQPSGYRQVQLNRDARTIFLPLAGMMLDLGGIAKGFALDRALARVQEMGAPESVSADFGGQLLFWHKSGSFGPETIMIEDPIDRRPAGIFQVSANCSISTSSNAERPGHLRNPLTGEPVPENGSVTVIALTGTEAEALSTALFVKRRFGIHHLS